MQKILFSCLCAAVISAAAAATLPEYRILLTPNQESNLLKNPGFDQQDSNGKPEFWLFDNCSQNSLLLAACEKMEGDPAITIRVADADTAELYGYWGQLITLPATGKYEFRCRLRTEDMSFAYWLTNNDGTFTALQMFPASSGEYSRKILDKFIDPEWLVTYHPDEWRPFGVDIDVPKLSQDGIFSVKIGAMAASAGWIAIDNAWFGALPMPVTVTVDGSGANALTVRHGDSVIAEQLLDPELSAQTVEIALPSGMARYVWEISTADKQIIQVNPEWR